MGGWCAGPWVRGSVVQQETFESKVKKQIINTPNTNNQPHTLPFMLPLSPRHSRGGGKKIFSRSKKGLFSLLFRKAEKSKNRGKVAENARNAKLALVPRFVTAVQTPTSHLLPPGHATASVHHKTDEFRGVYAENNTTLVKIGRILSPL